ncbi:hypothetical protein C8J56DRAFT_236293 [Mycena floridula]|nr:hypothetical protein C8J56DRAFT_236293 [Mycena floridula]
MSGPAILNVHTPTSSFAIVHSRKSTGPFAVITDTDVEIVTQELLVDLFDKLTRKVHSTYQGARVTANWLKYEFNDAVWSLDDESDYTIFVWRQQQIESAEHEASTSSNSPASKTPTLHLHDPNEPLPEPPAYQNSSYYLFHPSKIPRPSPRPSRNSSLRPKSTKSKKTKGSRRSVTADDDEPSFKKDFEKFHSENGVRTVTGSIGPVQNVRMLLKSGYRHVYISRKFATKHGFIPNDATPGHYGYSGLVNIGTWPITLNPSARIPSSKKTIVAPAPAPVEAGLLLGVPSTSSHIGQASSSKSKGSTHHTAGGPKVVEMSIYLAEEPHFDVVLGRAFFERRQIRTSAVDPTDIVCLDTGEKIECELVILKDGLGEIVTVT